MISPTGYGIRHDSMGSGCYRAPRGDRWHDGVDFLCEPGQDIVAPIAGVVMGPANPYPGGPYTGLVLEGNDCVLKIFYVRPLRSLFKKWVEQGEVIGKAQDISAKYGGGMLPHVHVRVISYNPQLLLKGD